MIAHKIRDFDRIKAKWPNGFKAFDVWLTGYRQRVGWEALFNSDSNWQDSEGRNAPTPKYHELPGAMQAGIWIQFMKERGGCEWSVDLFDWELLEDMEGMMPMLEDENSEEYGLVPTEYELPETAEEAPFISGDETLQGYPSEETARKASMGMGAAHELSKRLMRNNDGEETR